MIRFSGNARRALRSFGVALFGAVVQFATTGLLGGCEVDSSASGDGVPCDVRAVIDVHCARCHGAAPAFGAPMPLEHVSDFLAASTGDAARTVGDRVRERIGDDKRPMPPSPNDRLTDAERQTLTAWLDAGAPASAESCANSPAKAVGSELRCTPNASIRPTSKFVVPGEAEDMLICYGWESQHPKKRHIVGLRPAIDQPAQLHHVTLLESDRAVSPVPAPCSTEAMTAWRPIYGWAPGGSSLELPFEAGLPDGPSSHFVVQLHYVNPNHQRIEDGTGFDLCTTDELRPNDADVMAFGTTEITIPARGSLDVDCSVRVPDDGATTHLFSAFPHLHELGRSINTVVYPGGGGEPVDLGSVPAWDIGRQTWMPVDYTLRPGDVVRTRCGWDNPTSSAVGYGPTANDEMCFSFVMYFPRILASTWNWSLPSLYSECR